MRRKGKVHPSPSSSSSSTTSLHPCTTKDALSVLKLLPATILAMVSVLSLEESEVLAYMITRSIKSTNPSAFLEDNANKNSKKSASSSSSTTHRYPSFNCECFDCYTIYWSRWDSSPNRELIHQAIESFEEHLYNGEHSRKAKNKKKDKMGRRGVGKRSDLQAGNQWPEFQERSCVEETSSETPFSQLESADLVSESGESTELMSEEQSLGEYPEQAVALRGGGGASNHRGLARKLLPDVLGLLNSRLWGLWSPNV